MPIMVPIAILRSLIRYTRFGSRTISTISSSSLVRELIAGTLAKAAKINRARK
ncbi:hypothetical protein D3C71_2196030 [compost metagenome]